MEWQQLTTDAIEQHLVAAERAIAQARALQVSGLAELDRRQVPTADGCRSLREWTTGRLDVAPETAQVLASASRRLGDQPVVVTALARGEVTFDRACELAKVPNADDAVIGGSRHLDIATLRRHRALRNPLRGRHERHLDTYLRIQPTLDYTAGRLWGQLSGVACRTVQRALDARADAFPPAPGTKAPLATRRAHALCALAEDSLGSDDPGTTADPAPTVSVFVDAALAAPSRGQAGVATDGGYRVGPLALEGLICRGRVEVTVTGARPLALGRSSRVVPPRLRRMVAHRDGGCTADGCTSGYRLQPHHVVPWSQGGGTDPDNLTTLCWFHHHVVIHTWGYRLDPHSPPLRRRFLRPEGPDPPEP